MHRFPALLALPLAAALALSLGGCGPSPAPEMPAVRKAVPAKLRIAFVPPSATDEHWAAARAGANRAAAEFNVELTWPEAGLASTEERIALFNTYATSGQKGILVAPPASPDLASHVRAAVAKGVASLLLGDVDDRAAAADYAGWVATAERVTGATATHTLEALIGGAPRHEGRVLVLRHREDYAATRAREDAFVAELARFPQLRLDAQPFIDGSSASARASVASALAGHVRDNELALAGVFISHPSGAEAAALELQAMRERGVAVSAKALAIDESPALIDALQAGSLDALVVRDAEKMGYLAVRTLAQHLKGQKAPAYIDAGVKVKTKASTTASDKAATATPRLEATTSGPTTLGGTARP